MNAHGEYVVAVVEDQDIGHGMPDVAGHLRSDPKVDQARTAAALGGNKGWYAATRPTIVLGFGERDTELGNKGVSLPELAELLNTMTGRAAKFNTEKVKQEELASAGGAADDAA